MVSRGCEGGVCWWRVEVGDSQWREAILMLYWMVMVDCFRCSAEFYVRDEVVEVS